MVFFFLSQRCFCPQMAFVHQSGMALCVGLKDILETLCSHCVQTTFMTSITKVGLGLQSCDFFHSIENPFLNLHVNWTFHILNLVSIHQFSLISSLFIGDSGFKLVLSLSDFTFMRINVNKFKIF